MECTEKLTIVFPSLIHAQCELEFEAFSQKIENIQDHVMWSKCLWITLKMVVNEK